MYTVVGCPNCRDLWIRAAGGDRTKCPACGRSHQVDNLQPLFQSDDVDAARDARTRLLADRAEVDDVASFSSLADTVSDDDGDDPAELAALGLDPAEIADAGDQSTERRDRREIVLAAIETVDPATTDRIVATAAADGVPPTATETVLEKLHAQGEIAESGGAYRRV